MLSLIHISLPSGKAAKTEALVSILAEHPEGIVLYDRTRPHAVLLTDYTCLLYTSRCV